LNLANNHFALAGGSAIHKWQSACALQDFSADN